MTGHTIGSLTSGGFAEVDRHGALNTAGLSLDWCVGADDRWHVPAREITTRQQRPGPAPLFETVIRVPGGDVVHRAYGAAATTGPVIVVDIENRSPAALTAVLVVRLARRGTVAVEGATVRLDDQPVMVVSRPPGAWAAGPSTVAQITAGHARRGPVDTLVAPVEVALLFPVPHRTRIRAAAGNVGGPGTAPILVGQLPDPDDVARGWTRHLERGLQAELPVPVGERVDAARADLLLTPRGVPAVVAALEDWGFDHEAAAGWASLGWTGRRRARRRTNAADPWSALRSAEHDPVEFLRALRAVLVRDRHTSVELLPGFAPEWLGQALTVASLPLRTGPLSFALRWHGPRPALLWDAPRGVELAIPTLDPTWSSNTTAGDVLLAEPPRSLLAMGTHDRTVGETVDTPRQFS
ncbi:MAG TPA: hypothetical protein VK771_08385 [Acidimicrobiia bacterium]|nr:hypothetical protein [Acidimicrobiia bacterium]